jgi:hypothetical protein
MNARNKILLLTSLSTALFASACGTESSDVEQRQSELLSYAVPVGLRLTTIKMNGRSVNPAVPVDVYVTLPGLASTRVHIGDYSGKPVSNPLTQFNCSTTGALVGSDGYCTANLPLPTTLTSAKFTGTYPANTSSANASVRINGTTTNFTINSTGTPSLTCASAWMTINNQIDNDKITVCWKVSLAIPFISQPIVEAVFYPPPGEMSSVGLQTSNTLSQKTDYSYQFGTSSKHDFSFSVKGVPINHDLTFTSSTTLGGAITYSTGTTTGYSVRSPSLVPGPDDNMYRIKTKAQASFLDFGDGSKPSVLADMSTGHDWAITLGQLKGLAQNPQDVSTILPANQASALADFPRAVAQQIIGQDPFNQGLPITQVLAANPKRFIAANPSRVAWPHGIDLQQQVVTGSQTDRYFGQSTGAVYNIAGFGWDNNITITTTFSNQNQSTSTVNLQTSTPGIEGFVDLYMDTAFGTIIAVPSLEDSNIVPSDNCHDPSNPNRTSHRVLLPGQTLSKGQSLATCNGDWTISFQSDGMLVEKYRDGTVATSFYTPGGTMAIMQSDGNFVVKDASGNILAQTGTKATTSSGAFFILQESGIQAIYDLRTTPEGGTAGGIPVLWTMYPG